MNTILSVLTPLYSWCTSLGKVLRTNDDFVSYYQNYFNDGSVCLLVCLCAVVISLVLSCVYYFILCNLSFSAARRYMWFIFLLVSFVVTWFMTPTIIVGQYDSAGLYDGQNHTGVFESAKKTLNDNLQNIEDYEVRSETIQNAERYADRFRGSGVAMFTMSEKIPLQMSLLNGFYSVILFFVFSILFKRFTIHGKAIPF